MDIYYVKCTRDLDNRNIYVRSECGLSTWVDVLDVLMDSEFVITKSTDKKFEQMSAKNSSKMCYIINNKTYSGFIGMLEDNYVKTKNIFDKKQKSHT